MKLTDIDRGALGDVARLALVLVGATLAAAALEAMGLTNAAVVIIYVLSVQVISLITARRAYSFIGSVLAVMLYNFFFTEPRLSLQALGPGDPGTFAVMFLVALVSSSTAATLRRELARSREESRRTAVLLETDHLLQTCRDEQQIVEATGEQLAKLLRGRAVWYCALDGEPVPDRRFSSNPSASPAGSPVGPAGAGDADIELEVARRALADNTPAGFGTAAFPHAHGYYLPVHQGTDTLGIMGVMRDSEPLLDTERSIAAAVTGEASLTLERQQAIQERERAAVTAENERMKVSLLRSISHDLRTPLTTISGNADILLEEQGRLDRSTQQTLLKGIGADARWLNATVENLLAITKLDDGQVALERNAELLSDLVEEALRHVNPAVARHSLVLDIPDDLPSGPLLVYVNARLVVQVIVNLVNNAVVYTPDGSHITLSARANASGETVRLVVADDGPGIPAADHQRVFDSFVTSGKAIDGRRGIGLGLALCRSILNAHGGSIELDDNKPHGCVFTCTLPAYRLPQPRSA